jgi:hypothetical protein
MPKTITVSDETYEKIREQIEKEEKGKKHYPLVTGTEDEHRIILNLPDRFLAKQYQGKVIVLDRSGDYCNERQKPAEFGSLYRDEVQIFPVPD